jgi:hypothetical protein
LATINISDNSKCDDDENLYTFTPKKKSNLKQQGNCPGETSDLQDKFSLCISVYKPLIQVLSTSRPLLNGGSKKDTFFCIEAEDMSMFEMDIATADKLSCSLPNLMSRVDNPSVSSNSSKPVKIPESRAPRIGRNACFVPFLHRTTLHSSAQLWDSEYVNLTANSAMGSSKTLGQNRAGLPMKVRNHLYRLQLLLTSQTSSVNGVETLSNTVNFDMSIQDVSLR